MLVGAYPFEDPEEPRNFKKTITRILSVQYSFPDYVRVSKECTNLLSRIFVADPEKRISIEEIKKHPWFVKEASLEIKSEEDDKYCCQSMEEASTIIEEARITGDGNGSGSGSMELLEDEDDDEIEFDTSGDFVSAI